MKTTNHQAEMIEKIKSEIEKSGFPLELYVLGICSKKNMGRLPGIHYPYDGELREIDLYTFFEEISLDPKEGENFQHTSTALIIECKKSKGKPWIFFSSSRYQYVDVFHLTKYVSEFDWHFEQEKQYPLLGQIYKNLKNNHYMDKKIPRCISYIEAFKENKPSNSEIYKAIDSVLSFLRFRREWYLKKFEKYGFASRFLFPVIVLDGRLFEANVEEEKINVVEREHIQLRTDYYDDMFIIDIVKKEGFERFLKSIEKDHLSFVEAINMINFSESYTLEVSKRENIQTKKPTLDFPPEFYYRKVWK